MDPQVITRWTAQECGNVESPGHYRLVGWTRNSYDHNLTNGNARFHLNRNGLLCGSVDYSAGTNYNRSETAPFIGRWRDGSVQLDREDAAAALDVDLDMWTQFDASHTYAWEERYHGGRSRFYYSGRAVQGNDNILKLVGTYKMSGRNATGTFEYVVESAVERVDGVQTDADFEGSCIICFSEPADVGFVHGDSAHVCCCLFCANRVVVSGHDCPMCRRAVDKVASKGELGAMEGVTCFDLAPRS
eukprot:GFYU01031163.1.p2 GENE.GFYU01031163.1~~GFYU01031163.1.p2  ORF type:complete len:245 (-),score=32.25 GFYU01031163.1:213-947(-)